MFCVKTRGQLDCLSAGTLLQDVTLYCIVITGIVIIVLLLCVC